MAVVTVQLSRAAIVDVATASIAALSMLLLFRFRINSAWLVIGAGIAGLVITAR
jgi:chromate transporter